MSAGLHVAVIMDGNGRWATARGRSRTAGHAAGADAVRRTVEAAPRLGISTLTLYAFSSDNWQRPPQEVRALMGLFRRYLRAEAERCAENGVRIEVIGRRDRLSPTLLEVIRAAEAATAAAGRLHLRIAVDYSARDAILRAAQRLRERGACTCGGAGSHAEHEGNGGNGRDGTHDRGSRRPGGRRRPGGAGEGAPSREEFARLLADPPHDGRPVPDVDLLIRTGGEKRLSDFLLWECAYAELVFTDRMWPDFAAADLEEAVASFGRRERRFGRASAAAPSPAAAGEPVELPRVAAGESVELPRVAAAEGSGEGSQVS